MVISKLMHRDYETIGVEELRLLNDLSKLNIALTKEEYFRIVNIYAGVLNRLNNKLPEGY